MAGTEPSGKGLEGCVRRLLQKGRNMVARMNLAAACGIFAFAALLGGAILVTTLHVFASARRETDEKLSSPAARPAAGPIDVDRAKGAAVVLRVRHSAEMGTAQSYEGGVEKSFGDYVSIVEVYKNEGPDKELATRGWTTLWHDKRDLLPIGEFTAYLQPAIHEKGPCDYRFVGGKASDDAMNDGTIKEGISDKDSWGMVTDGVQTRLTPEKEQVKLGEIEKKERPSPKRPEAMEKPAFGIKCQREGDVVAVSKEDTRIVVTVTSSLGIGNAAITRQDVAWPSEMVLRLKLAGMESLRLENGTLQLNASVTSHSGFGRAVHLIKPGAETQVLDASCLRAFAADGKPTDALAGQGGWFELDVPRIMLGDEVKTLTVGWIDFFR